MVNNNFSAVVPYDMELQRKESKEFLDDLTSRDQRMFLCVLTLVHTADSKEELDNDTEILLTTGRKHLCQLSVLKYQQLDGLITMFNGKFFKGLGMFFKAGKERKKAKKAAEKAKKEAEKAKNAEK